MDIPRFQGDPSPTLDKLNGLVDGHNSIKEIRGDEVFIAVRKTQQGHTVTLNIAAVLARIPKLNRTVIFPVRLKNRTGTPGSATVISAEKYDVYLLDNTTQLGTAVVVDTSPCRGFPMLIQNAADRGQAYFDLDNTLRIANCNESSGNKSCPPPP